MLSGVNVHMATKDGERAKSDNNDMNSESLGESESLSDIDDQEVDGYFLNEEEKNMKKILWEDMNREYLEKEAAKQAEANFQNCSEDFLAARELVQSVGATVAKSRKEKRQKQLQEEKSMGPAQSPPDASSRMLKRKRLESKVNFDLLEKLFGTDNSENPKKVQ
ncbi:transcription factor IIIB 60 kDa subunit-like isoform X2 [Lotus japonicus]|uniref:transcription factor IIIB 60 kDa subunit-like isoform X2 n=1 Tax=Lotus japonicus TaxID=34305 RepID=UPI002585FDAA|nr:transcription factor IIIB 60 kDa subunit-like isoform X2 [Lotus japonicus]